MALDWIASESADREARVVALKHRRCHPSTLAAAARRAARHLERGHHFGAQQEYAAAVAANPKAPPRALRRLARTGDGRVLTHLAANPAAPEQILADLAEAEDSLVRRGVAQNASTPPQVLAGLASDGISQVRAAVAANPSTPAGSLQVLAVDESPDVRAAATGNPSTLAAGRTAGGLLAD